MKTKKIVLGMGMILLSGVVLFTACRKKDTNTATQQPDNDYSTANDNNLSESAANDAMSMGSQLSENSGNLTTYKSSDPSQQFQAPELMLATACATISPTMSGTIITGYTVDFGTSGCVGQDYRTRKGKLVFDFSQSSPGSNRYRKPGFKMLISSQNYIVDGNAVALSKTVTNTSPLAISGQTAYSGTNLTWHIDANVNITKSGGGNVSWNCSRDKELINSNDPTCYKGQLQAIDWTKAKIKLNGNANGTNSSGESYTAVATDLVRDFTCAPNITEPHRHPFVSGTIAYTPGSKPTRTINYGDGSCDFNATVTVNGNTYTLSVH